MRRTTLQLLAGSGAVIVAAVSSGAQATNLLANGGFEGGVYSSTIGGYTNNSVPDGWTSTIGYDYQPGFNHIQTGAYYVQSGSQSLSISNYDYDPYVATLTQTFSDVLGARYTASFWAFDGGANGDTNAYLDVSVGANGVTLNDTIAHPFQEFSFKFVGTGSDTLTIAAQTNPSEWYVDTVSVSGVPESSTWAMMLLGFAGLGFVGYRQSRKGRVALALPA